MTAPSCQIELEFADGQYVFRLPLPQLAELQEKCGAGIGAIYARVLRGRYVQTTTGITFGSPMEAEYRVEDLVETVRLALIGGGKGEVDGESVVVDPIKAKRLVETYVVQRPLKEGWALAAAILTACVEGYSDPEAEPPKKDVSAKTGAASTTPTP